MFMKGYVILSIAFSAVMAQRAPYAGSSPKGRPELASRFKDTNTGSSSSSTTGISIDNRVGDSTTVTIPVDARGDAHLVNRLNQWPREHRPFWLLNAEHIEASRHPQEGNINRNQQAAVNTQSRFGGRNYYEDDERNLFGGSNDSQGNVNFQSRSNFDYDNFGQDQTRPARPAQTRPFFSGSGR